MLACAFFCFCADEEENVETISYSPHLDTLKNLAQEIEEIGASSSTAPPFQTGTSPSAERLSVFLERNPNDKVRDAGKTFIVLNYKSNLFFSGKILYEVNNRRYPSTWELI